MTTDPTREEMLAELASMPFAEEFDEFDREEAIYWFANDWHGGQSSNLYSALSTSPYRPGPLERGESARDGICYQRLEDVFSVECTK